VDFPATRAVVDDGCSSAAYPAAAIEVGGAMGPRWQYVTGRLSADDAAPTAGPDTVFDLASLTKVIATAALVMRQVESGRLTLETSIADTLRGWAGPVHRAIRVRHLLDHSSGLPAHARIWERAQGREAYEAAIRAMPLERPPGVRSVYSDPGFILLGFILEDLAGAPLDTSFSTWTRTWLAADLRFTPPASWRARIAATEFDPWRGRMLVGEVHDENAAALGGVAGHAGLFGTISAVGQFGALVLRTFETTTALASPALMRLFATKTGVAGSSRALGWDTMLPTSSCGARLSPSAIGHTGFTGTSIWIDPERDLYVVFLTNRVHPTRQNEALARLRPRVHDAVIEDIEGSNSQGEE
jgi:CubicO group peptidase (beta-lactamase class C family)